MRSLKESILSNSKVGKYDEWGTFKRENAYPASWDELKYTVHKAIELKGNKVGLNWINTSAVTDISYMFQGEDFNGDISKWDVSKVENMSHIFEDSSFNGDISKWNVSKVENMYSMFENSKFNGDISKWDVSNVYDMGYMFYKSKFNGDISEWDVSNVETMSYMFASSPFNGDLSKWDISMQRIYGIFRNTPLEKNPPEWYKNI